MVAEENGHAFISYVREDAARVDRLQRILEAAGIRVWRDTAELWPGDDWRSQIRRAVTTNTLVFIACFSSHSVARELSYQNEELNLAIEQLRLRRPDRTWLIPVRFDDVELPDLEIGAGRTLNSLQRADLIGDSWDEGAARVVAGVLRILGRSVPPPTEILTESLEAQLRLVLRDPAGGIDLDDMLMPIAEDVRVAIMNEEAFPSSSSALQAAEPEASLYIVSVVDEYLALLTTALQALAVMAQWSTEAQLPTLRRFFERLLPRNAGGSGMVVLTGIRWFPLVPCLYSGAIAAVHRRNFGVLRTLAIDAMVRDPLDGSLPVIARANPWRPFSHFSLPAQVLAFRAAGEEPTRDLAKQLRSKRRGNRHTPLSDYWHDALRPKFRRDIPDDDDFADLFDEVEMFLALLAADARAQQTERVYFDQPFFGRATWRSRHAPTDTRVEIRLQQEFLAKQSRWEPLESGLFGGSVERAKAAFDVVVAGASDARTHQW